MATRRIPMFAPVIAFVPGVVLLATAACGTSPGTGASPGGSTAAAATSTTAAPATATTDASHPPATPSQESLGEATRPTAATVYVTVPTGRLRLDRPLTVIVVNGLGATVYADDSKTGCSVVTVQQRSSSPSWVAVGGCQQQRPPRVVAIGPDHARTITLQLTGPNAANPDAPAVRPGDYRVGVEYRLTEDAVAGVAGTTTWSHLFHLS